MSLSFAVIIPVFNGEAYINNAVESCLQQTVLPDEIIIIDDASTDATADKIRMHDSPLIKYIRNEKNAGPSLSRNRGLQMATSSWILFLDADDIFHPQKIEIIRHCIEQNSSVFAIGHDFNLLPDKKNNINSQWRSSLPFLKRFSTADILMRNRVVTPALAVAASNHVLFNEAMMNAEDHDFILRTAEQFGLWYLDLPLCTLQRMPLTPGGLSSNRWKMRKGEIRMLVDYCKRHKSYLSLPFLVLFSLLKHVRNGFLLSKNRK